MEYLDFFQNLNKNKVSYLICGGLAVNIYGIPRMTADIDLLLDFEANNIKGFEEVLKKFKYNPALPITLSSLIDEKKRKVLKQEKNLIAFSYFNSVSNMMSINVLIEPPISFEIMWEKKEVRKIGETEINLVSIEHLIDMKKYSGRVQDEQDIIHLTKFIKR